MNLFILDTDLDKCAQAHIDLHVGKMQLEAAQLLSTTVWIDRVFGHVPRALYKEELDELKKRVAPARNEPIDERKAKGYPARYLPTHPNHPCAIWVRTNLSNYEWTLSYVDALDCENQWRGNKPHASCAEAFSLPDPQSLPCDPLSPFALAMPDEYKFGDAVDAYRHYYMGEKADIAVWKRRGKPEWWDENLVMRAGDDPHENYLKTVKATVNKTKAWSKGY